MGRWHTLVLVAACFTCVASAHDVITTKLTWSREISRVFRRHCTSCHQAGGAAFDLTTYEQARPWAEAIKEEVLERRMPPWPVMKGFGEFKQDSALTQEEIELISSWVVGGAPEGDPSLLPKGTDAQTVAPNPSTSGTVAIRGDTVLDQDLIVAGIRATNLAAGSSTRVMAERPDGSIEPLIWIYNYAPRFAQAYYFRAPVRLPAKTRIQMTLPEGEVLLLLLKR